MRKLLLLIVIGAGGGLLLPQTRERLLDVIPFVVGSPGSDQEAGTPDDVRLLHRR